MQQSTLRFPCAERLKSRKQIGQLITADSSSFIYPFRIAWMIRDLEGGYPLQIAFSVPKRRIRGPGLQETPCDEGRVPPPGGFQDRMSELLAWWKKGEPKSVTETCTQAPHPRTWPSRNPMR